MRRMLLICMSVLSFVLSGGMASADFYVIAGGRGVGTVISSLPYTITKSGSYYIKGDLESTGTGITVEEDHVTIDLMGYSLIGPGSGTNYGIHMDGRVNVEVRNGIVRGFGKDGIIEYDGKNHRLINVRAVGNGDSGIALGGYGHLVKDCTASDNISIGINVGYGSTVTGNTAYANQRSGIYLSYESLVDGNTAYSNNRSGGGHPNISSCGTCTFGLNHAP